MTNTIPYEQWRANCAVRRIADGQLLAPPGPLPDEIPADYIRRAIIEAGQSRNSDLQGGLYVEQVTVRGGLHLENLDVTIPLFFRQCWFDRALHVWRMRARTINFEGCVLGDGAEMRGTSVAGHLCLRNCRVLGPLVARDMRVEGQVDVTGSAFVYDGTPESELASIADGECFGFSRSTASSLYWRDLPTPPSGRVVLRDASVGSFVHDIDRNKLASWPQKGRLVLDGFQYGRLDQMSATQGLKWLELQGEFVASSYAMLARGFHRLSLPHSTEDVLAALKKREIRNMRSPIRRLANYAVFGVIGYGKSPSRALLILVALFFFHISAGTYLASQGLMQPVVNEFLLEPCFITAESPCARETSDWLVVSLPDGAERRVPPTYPEFSPLAYSLESFFPFVSFDQRRYWEPHTLSLQIILSAIAGVGLFLGGVFVGSVSGLLSPRVEH